MNLKQLLFLNKAIGKSDVVADYNYTLVAYCGTSQSGDDKHVVAESSTSAYVAGYLSDGDGYRIRNASGMTGQKYPIPLNGASKVRFELPNDGIKATIFFTNSKALAYGYYAHYVGGDPNPYSADAPNGTREIEAVEGADSFAFSLYWKNNEITDAIMDEVVIKLIK